ncbi:MAG: hypothetical protein Q9223_002684 [Gallowayella weberi]
MDDVLNRIANVMNVVGPRGLPPRDAIMLLARAGWNSAMAIQQYIEVYRRPQVAQEIRKVLNPPPEKPKDYEWSYMRWRGHVVVDIDQTPLRDYRHIPSTLASDSEPGLLEALQRFDSRVRLQDLAARQYTERVIQLPTSGQLKARDNKLSQRIRRFRERNTMITWKDARSGNDTYHQWLDAHLPPHFKANNTTRGLPELNAAQIQEIKQTGAAKSKQPAKTERPRKPGGNLADLLLKLERLEKLDMVQVEEEWCGSDTDSDSAEMHTGPDSRYDVPNNIEEEAELHDAMFPSIYHYLQITGDLPVIIHWQSSYMSILAAINKQLRVWSERRGESSTDLVGWGFWTGGISGWHTTKLEASPLAKKHAEIERDEEKTAKGDAAVKKRAATAESKDDVEMGEADDTPVSEREVSEPGKLQESGEQGLGQGSKA